MFVDSLYKTETADLSGCTADILYVCLQLVQDSQLTCLAVMLTSSMFVYSLYKTETADLSGCMADILSVDNVHIIYNAFFAAMEDYTLDSRGDVGAG